MFHKRKKKIFPPGTFIATPARIAAILHLCLAFTLFLWITSQPFMGDLFSIKSEMLLYESLFDQSQLMEKLPPSQQKNIESEYEALKSKLRTPFLEKFKTMLLLLFVHTPALKLTWLFFSFVIALMLLMRIEGAAIACWILPIITLSYAIDNQMYMNSEPSDLDRGIFPSEKYIVLHYLEEPLSSDIYKQQAELTKGWQHYLVKEWAKENPADDRAVFMHQIAKGEFAFNLARLQVRKGNPILAIEKPPQKQPIGILSLYLAWNCFFAFMAYWYVARNDEKPVASLLS